MDIKAFLTHVVKLEIRIRKAINTQMHGNFSSVFKGSGLEFSDLRQSFLKRKKSKPFSS
jgi:hypothetical protein